MRLVFAYKIVLTTGENNAPSVDRIMPSLGYVKGNVRVISARANLLKNNAELWELEKVLEDLRCLTKKL